MRLSTRLASIFAFVVLATTASAVNSLPNTPWCIGDLLALPGWNYFTYFEQSRPAGRFHFLKAPRGARGASWEGHGKNNYTFWLFDAASGTVATRTVPLKGTIGNLIYVDERHVIYNTPFEGIETPTPVTMVQWFDGSEPIAFEGTARGFARTWEVATNPDHVAMLTNETGVGLVRNKLAIYNRRTGAIVHGMREPTEADHLRNVTRCRDGSFVAIDSQQNFRTLSPTLKEQSRFSLGLPAADTYDFDILEREDGQFVAVYGGPTKRYLVLIDPKRWLGKVRRTIAIENPSQWAQWITTVPVDGDQLVVVTPKSAGETSLTELRLVDPSTGAIREIPGVHRGAIYSFHRIPGNRLLTFGADRKLLLWDLTRGRVIARVDPFEGNELSPRAINAAGTHFLYYAGGALKLLDVEKMPVVR